VRTGVALRKPHPLGGKPVNVGREDLLLSVTPEVPESEVVSHDEDNVRRGRGGADLRRQQKHGGRENGAEANEVHFTELLCAKNSSLTSFDWRGIFGVRQFGKLKWTDHLGSKSPIAGVRLDQFADVIGLNRFDQERAGAERIGGLDCLNVRNIREDDA
jgi:hypothetical protein